MVDVTNLLSIYARLKEVRAEHEKLRNMYLVEFDKSFMADLQPFRFKKRKEQAKRASEARQASMRKKMELMILEDEFEAELERLSAEAAKQ